MGTVLTTNTTGSRPVPRPVPFGCSRSTGSRFPLPTGTGTGATGSPHRLPTAGTTHPTNHRKDRPVSAPHADPDHFNEPQDVDLLGALQSCIDSAFAARRPRETDQQLEQPVKQLQVGDVPSVGARVSVHADRDGSELATHQCDGCGTQTARRVCGSCWGTTDDPMWCKRCNGVCRETPDCSPMREDRRALAGAPLHEATDRDGGDVPSDRRVADATAMLRTVDDVLAVADAEIARAWDEGYRFGRLMQFDADWADKPKWFRHNSRKSLVANLDSAARDRTNRDNPYRAALCGPEPTKDGA